MLLLLQHHFSDSPAKKRVALGLYRRGISVKNGHLYTDTIEISPAQVARALGVNRRTVYETIKQITEQPELSIVMSNIFPEVNSVSLAPVVGSQVIIIYANKGCFQRVFNEFFEKLKAYFTNVKEVVSKTVGANDSYIRVIMETPIPVSVIHGFEEVKGVSRVVVLSPEPEADGILCGTCRTLLFPSKLTTPIEGIDDPLSVTL